MKQKKLLILNIFLSFTLLFFLVNVNAKEKPNSSIKIEQVEKGQEIEFFLQLFQEEEINNIGIQAYKATLEYDSSLFEEVKYEDFTLLNGWEELQYNPKTKEITSIKRKGTAGKENVLKVKLKLKQDVKQGISTKVGFVEVQTAKEGIDLPNIEVEQQYEVIDKVSSEENIPKPPMTPVKPNGSKPSETPQFPSIESQDSINNSQSTGVNTGDSSVNFWLLIIVEILAGGVLIVVFLKSKRGKKVGKQTKRALMGILCFLLVAQIGIGVYASSSKGDVNMDGKINYDDLRIIQKHMIHLDNMEEQQQSIADFNNDKQITVADLTLLVDKINNQIEYDVKLKSTLSKKLYQKNETFQFTFQATMNYKEEIKSVILNDKSYPVIKVNENEYAIEVTTPSQAGEISYEITEVTLVNDKKVKTSLVENIQIAKDDVTISNYRIEEDLSVKKVIFQFDLNDVDNAFVDGKVVMKEKASQVQEEVKLKAAGNQKVEFNVKENVEYMVQVYVSYKKDNVNIVENQLLLEVPYELIKEYKVNLKNIKVIDKEGNIIKYANKNDKLKVQVEIENNTDYKLKEIVLEKETIPVTYVNNNIYQFEITAPNTSGKFQKNITKIILENLKEFEVTDKFIVIEVLKDKPTVHNFSFKRLNNNQVEAEIQLQDKEATILSGSIQIFDDTKQEIKRVDLNTDTIQKVIFDLTHRELYTIQVLVNYDLDSNKEQKDNQYSNVNLFTEEFKIAQELIEYKDIKSVELYEQSENFVQIIEELNTKEFQPELYVAKIKMEKMPSFYAEVQAGEVVNNEFILTLKTKNTVQYSKDQINFEVKVKYGNVDAHGIAKTVTFGSLIEKIKANPKGSYTLTQDLDANEIDVTTQVYIENFKGTLNGNGYTIHNLRKPLFGLLENANIQNLVIENANIQRPSEGILANRLNHTKVTNVHIYNSIIESIHDRGVGSFAGIGENNTIISQSSSSNTTVSGGKRVGGFLGYMKSNSEIDNSYMHGKVISTEDAVGGMVGEQTDGGASIKNCYVDIEFLPNVKHAAGGFIGYSGPQNILLENNISLARGQNGNRFGGRNHNRNSKNNYGIKESILGTDLNKPGINEIEEAKINSDFLKNTLTWSSDIWDLENISFKEMPKLRNSDPRNKKRKDHPTNEQVYIPNFERLSKLSGFNSDREIAYHNMSKLLPFYDSKYIVQFGNQMEQDSLMNTQLIDYIFAYDQNNKVVTGLNSDTYKNLKKLVILYKNNQKEEYALTFNKRIENVAVYTIEQLGVAYNYSNYILDLKDPIITNLQQEISTYTYNQIKVGYSENGESRLYPEHYNNVVSKKLNEFVISLLQSQSDYTIYLDNEIVRKKILQDLKNKDLLKQIVYTYNYYDRWYDIEIGGMNLRDLLLFNSSQFDTNSTIVSNTITLKNSNQRASHQTDAFYTTHIKTKVGNKSLKQFIDDFVITLTEFKDPNDWFIKTFKGLVYEARPFEEWVSYGYRAWELINRKGNWALPILTLPTSDMYIVTTVGHIYTGSMNLYSDYKQQENELNKDKARERMMNKMQSYGDKYAKYYSFMLNTVPNPESMRNRSMVHFDTKYFDYENEKLPLDITKTQEPVLKNFTNAVNVNWNNVNGVAAYANGTDVFWIHHSQLDDYRTSTHESVHNEDGNFIFGGHGRRKGSDPEWYTNNVNTQEFSGERTVYNFTYEFDYADEISVNFKTDSVYGADKVHKYYQNMFDMIYVLDYLQGKAFLQLRPEEQAMIAQQYNWGDLKPTDRIKDDVGVEVGKGKFVNLTAKDFEAMQLKTMEDLYEYRIVMNRNNNGTPASIYHTYWYMPHFDTGVGDNNAHYFISKEMMGYKGWKDGYVAYASGQYNEDLKALKAITGYNSFQEYKKVRYQQVSENLAKIPYFQEQEVIEAFKIAYQNDANANSRGNERSKNIRRMLYNNIKRLTQDFSQSVYDPATIVHVSTANELLNTIKNNPMAYIVLDQDINMQSLNSNNEPTYLNLAFVGKIDGNNKKIKNVQKALFKEVKFAEIKDLEIESPIYLETVNGAIANEKATVVTYKNVVVSNSNLHIPFNYQSDVAYITKDSSITSNVVEIHTVDDILKIKNDTTGKARKLNYKLMQDIDLSSITQGDAIIEGQFLGTFDGNGHRLYNTKKALFDVMKGTIKNLTLENVHMGSRRRVKNWGAVARKAEYATFENLSLNNVKIDGDENTGGVVGEATRSTFRKIRATGLNLYNYWYYVAGLVGRSYNNTIEDIVLQGEIRTAETHAGGLIGGSNQDNVNRVYIDVNVKKVNGYYNRNRNGGLYGNIEKAPVSFRNSVVVSGMSQEVFKITPAEEEGEIYNIKNYLNNIYENENETGKSTSDIVPEIVKKASQENLRNKDFYIKNLYFTEDIWNFEGLEKGIPPKFKQELK